jgi:putative endonuclease
MNQYWVYMLLCWDGSYYVGVTSRLDQRLEEHQSGIDRECFTRTRRPVLLVHSETFRTPEEAIAAEKRIKGWSRAKKRALIAGSWCEIRRLSRGSANAGGAIVSHPSTGSG